MTATRSEFEVCEIDLPSGRTLQYVSLKEVERIAAYAEQSFAEGFKQAQQAAQRLILQAGHRRLSGYVGDLKASDYRALAKNPNPSGQVPPGSPTAAASSETPGPVGLGPFESGELAYWIQRAIDTDTTCVLPDELTRKIHADLAARLAVHSAGENCADKRRQLAPPATENEAFREGVPFVALHCAYCPGVFGTLNALNEHLDRAHHVNATWRETGFGR